MKRHLQCAEQQVSRSNLTKYCTCHAESLAYLVLITYETSFRVRGATGVTIQPHQILRLPRKMTRLLYRSHIWNVISNARSNRCHYPTSPNTAPATKNDTARFQRKSPKTGETSFPMRGRSDHDPTMIRAWSENENANRNPPRKWGYFARSPEAFSIVKYNVLHPILQSNFHQILRLPRKVTLQLHQVLRLPRKVPLERHQVLHLPRKMTRLLYRPHIWNVISNARSNRCHYPTSPNTAPATKNDTARCQRKSPKTGETSFPMRGRSDHDPTMIRAWSENENANRNPPRKWGYFARSPEAFSIVKYNVLHPILQSNFHQILRLPRKVTLQLHQVLRLLRKVPLERHHQVLHLPRKVTLELHQVVHLPRKVTLELHQVLRLPLHEVWRRLYLTLLDTTLLDSTLLDSTLLDTTLLDSTLLDSTLLDTTLLDSTLLDSTLLDTTLLDSTLLDSTLLDTTLLD